MQKDHFIVKFLDPHTVQRHFMQLADQEVNSAADDQLKVYAGAEHPHAAQNPIVLDIASQNPKNKGVRYNG